MLTLSTELRVAKAEFPFSVVLPSAIVREQLVLPWISLVCKFQINSNQTACPSLETKPLQCIGFGLQVEPNQIVHIEPKEGQETKHEIITSCSELCVWARSKSEDVAEPVVDRPEEVVDRLEEIAEEGAKDLSLCGREEEETQSKQEKESTAPEGGEHWTGEKRTPAIGFFCRREVTQIFKDNVFKCSSSHLSTLLYVCALLYYSLLSLRGSPIYL